MAITALYNCADKAVITVLIKTLTVIFATGFTTMFTATVFTATMFTATMLTATSTAKLTLSYLQTSAPANGSAVTAAGAQDVC